MNSNKYIKVEIGESIIIKVAKISWKTPHEDVINWVIYDEKNANTSEEEINKVIETILLDKNYFDSCWKCHFVFPTGHLGNVDYSFKKKRGSICHSCMSDYFKIVF